MLWNRAKEELERKIWEETQKQRRPSRFEVIPAPDIFKLRQHSTSELISPSNLASGDVKGVSGKDHGADRAGNREGFQETDFFFGWCSSFVCSIWKLTYVTQLLS